LCSASGPKEVKHAFQPFCLSVFMILTLPLFQNHQNERNRNRIDLRFRFYFLCSVLFLERLSKDPLNFRTLMIEGGIAMISSILSSPLARDYVHRVIITIAPVFVCD
jgi:riboflavin biosynthesis pyrimidine reductase